jgi:NAD-dependent deacetylase
VPAPGQFRDNRGLIDQARDWLRSARAAAVLTGAGISAESGVPTFRGAGGLWKNFRPEELATPEAFRRDPALVWEWYDWRRGLIRGVEPNAGHYALARWQMRHPALTLITQNVDGLHDRAGSTNILKLHGDIWTVRCTGCGTESRDERVPLDEIPPKCGRCGGLLRPAIVWFGEALPQAVWMRAEEAVESCDVLLVAGTSAVVYPAASLVPQAKARGARVIEVNLEETPMSGLVDASLLGKAGEILPKLLT